MPTAYAMYLKSDDYKTRWTQQAKADKLEELNEKGLFQNCVEKNRVWKYIEQWMTATRYTDVDEFDGTFMGYFQKKANAEKDDAETPKAEASIPDSVESGATKDGVRKSPRDNKQTDHFHTQEMQGQNYKNVKGQTALAKYIAEIDSKTPRVTPQEGGAAAGGRDAAAVERPPNPPIPGYFPKLPHNSVMSKRTGDLASASLLASYDKFLSLFLDDAEHVPSDTKRELQACLADDADDPSPASPFWQNTTTLVFYDKVTRCIECELKSDVEYGNGEENKGVSRVTKYTTSPCSIAEDLPEEKHTLLWQSTGEEQGWWELCEKVSDSGLNRLAISTTGAFRSPRKCDFGEFECRYAFDVMPFEVRTDPLSEQPFCGEYNAQVEDVADDVYYHTDYITKRQYKCFKSEHNWSIVEFNSVGYYREIYKSVNNPHHPRLVESWKPHAHVHATPITTLVRYPLKQPIQLTMSRSTPGYSRDVNVDKNTERDRLDFDFLVDGQKYRGTKRFKEDIMTKEILIKYRSYKKTTSKEELPNFNFAKPSTWPKIPYVDTLHLIECDQQIVVFNLLDRKIVCRMSWDESAEGFLGPLLLDHEDERFDYQRVMRFTQTYQWWLTSRDDKQESKHGIYTMHRHLPVVGRGFFLAQEGEDMPTHYCTHARNVDAFFFDGRRYDPQTLGKCGNEWICMGEKSNHRARKKIESTKTRSYRWHIQTQNKVTHMSDLFQQTDAAFIHPIYAVFHLTHLMLPVSEAAAGIQQLCDDAADIAALGDQIQEATAKGENTDALQKKRTHKQEEFTTDKSKQSATLVNLVADQLDVVSNAVVDMVAVVTAIPLSEYTIDLQRTAMACVKRTQNAMLGNWQGISSIFGHRHDLHRARSASVVAEHVQNASMENARILKQQRDHHRQQLDEDTRRSRESTPGLNAVATSAADAVVNQSRREVQDLEARCRTATLQVEQSAQEAVLAVNHLREVTTTATLNEARDRVLFMEELKHMRELTKSELAHLGTTGQTLVTELEHAYREQIEQMQQDITEHKAAAAAAVENYEKLAVRAEEAAADAQKAAAEAASSVSAKNWEAYTFTERMARRAEDAATDAEKAANNAEGSAQSAAGGRVADINGQFGGFRPGAAEAQAAHDAAQQEATAAAAAALAVQQQATEAAAEIERTTQAVRDAQRQMQDLMKEFQRKTKNQEHYMGLVAQKTMRTAMRIDRDVAGLRRKAAASADTAAASAGAAERDQGRAAAFADGAGQARDEVVELAENMADEWDSLSTDLNTALDSAKAKERDAAKAALHAEDEAMHVEQHRIRSAADSHLAWNSARTARAAAEAAEHDQGLAAARADAADRYAQLAFRDRAITARAATAFRSRITAAGDAASAAADAVVLDRRRAAAAANGAEDEQGRAAAAADGAEAERDRITEMRKEIEKVSGELGKANTHRSEGLQELAEETRVLRQTQHENIILREEMEADKKTVKELAARFESLIAAGADRPEQSTSAEMQALLNAAALQAAETTRRSAESDARVASQVVQIDVTQARIDIQAEIQRQVEDRFQALTQQFRDEVQSQSTENETVWSRLAEHVDVIHRIERRIDRLPTHTVQVHRDDPPQYAALTQAILDLRVDMQNITNRLAQGLAEQQRIVGREGARNFGDVDRDVQSLQVYLAQLNSKHAALQKQVDDMLETARRDQLTAQSALQQTIATMVDARDLDRLHTLMDRVEVITTRVTSLEAQSADLRAGVSSSAPAAPAGDVAAAVLVQGQAMTRFEQAVIHDTIHACVADAHENLESKLQIIRDEIRYNEMNRVDAQNQHDADRNTLRAFLQIEDDSVEISRALVDAWSTFVRDDQNFTHIPPAQVRGIFQAMTVIIAARGPSKSAALAALLVALQAVAQLDTIQRIAPRNTGNGGAASSMSMQIDRDKKRFLLSDVSEAEVRQITEGALDGRIDVGSALVPYESSRGRNISRNADGRETKRSKSVTGRFAQAATAGMSMLSNALTNWRGSGRPPPPDGELDDDDMALRLNDGFQSPAATQNALVPQGASIVPGRATAAPRAQGAKVPPATLSPAQQVARNAYQKDLKAVDECKENVKKLKIERDNEKNLTKIAALKKNVNVEVDKLDRLTQQMKRHASAGLVQTRQVDNDLAETAAARLAAASRPIIPGGAAGALLVRVPANMSRQGREEDRDDQAAGAPTIPRRSTTPRQLRLPMRYDETSTEETTPISSRLPFAGMRPVTGAGGPAISPRSTRLLDPAAAARRSTRSRSPGTHRDPVDQLMQDRPTDELMQNELDDAALAQNSRYPGRQRLQNDRFKASQQGGNERSLMKERKDGGYR